MNQPILIGNCHNKKRLYACDVTRFGRQLNFPGNYYNSDCRIREVAIRLFRRWFGTKIKTWWNDDGYAEAWDSRGNKISISQLDKGNPLCPK